LIIFNLKNPFDDTKLVLKPFDLILSAEELVAKLEGIRYYLATRTSIESSEIAVEKIISESHDFFTVEERFNLFVASRSRQYDKYVQTEQIAILHLVNVLYDKGLKKFNNANELVLSHACYLIELEKKENLSLEKAIYLESMTENLNMLYNVQSLKDYIMNVQKERTDDMYSDSLRFEQIMNKRLEDKLNSLMLKATQSMNDFYQMLDEEGLLMKRIEMQLTKVAKTKRRIEEFWLANVSVFAKNNEIMDKIEYLFKHIYDKEQIGDVYIDNLVEKKRDLKVDKLKYFNIDQPPNNISDPTLVIRLLDNDFIIEELNQAVLRLLGYLRKDLIGKQSTPNQRHLIYQLHLQRTIRAILENLQIKAREPNQTEYSSLSQAQDRIPQSCKC